MRKNRLIAFIGTLTMAAAGLAAVSAGVSSKKAESVSAGDKDIKGVYMYFKPNSQWKADSASFKLHAWSGTEEWINCTPISGTDWFYAVPTKTNWDFQFVRCNSAGTTNWNYTNNLSYTTCNAFETKYGPDNGECNWYEKKATVSYDKNGGSGTLSSVSYTNPSTFTLPNSSSLTKSGFNLVGWEIGGVTLDCGGSYNVTASHIVNDSSLQFKAVWEEQAADTYTVAFNNNGGSGAMTSIVTEVGSTTAVPSCTFTAPAGYKFKEWNSQADGMGDTYNSTHPVPSQAKDTTKTIYAIWQLNNPQDGKHITVYVGGHINRVGDLMTYDSGKAEWSGSITLAEGEEFKVVNYTNEAADAWYANIQKDASDSAGNSTYGPQISGGGSGISASNMKAEVAGTYTVYMKNSTDFEIYIPYINFTVTYHANGGTVGSTPDGQVDRVAVGQSEIVRAANTYSAPSGKLFRGWATSSTGAVVYQPGAEISLTQGQNVDLYAIFTDKTIADGYYAEGKIGGVADTKLQLTQVKGTGSDTEYYLTGVSLSAGDSFKFGHIVDEHHPDGGYYGGSLYNTDSGNAVDAGQMHIETTTGSTHDNFVVDVAGSYDLYLKPDATGESANKKVWIGAIKYNVAYNANGGTGDDISEPVNVGTASTAKASNTFTAPAHATFKEWNTSSNGLGTSYAAGATIASQAQNSTLNLYAIWNYESQVTVTYHNEDTSVLATKSGYTGDAIDNIPEVPEKTGYSGSWNPNLSVFPASSTDVNPVYSAIEYNVTLDPQGGSDGSTSVEATYDAAMPQITVPKRTGYTFGGYYSATGASGTKYYNSDGTSAHSYDIAGNTTLYASWSATTYSITYQTNGATLDGSQATSYNIQSSAINLPSESSFTEKPEGCDFGGWYESSTFEGSPVTSIPTGSTGNKEFFAKWIGNVTVTFKADGQTIGTISGHVGDSIDSSDIPAVPGKTGYHNGHWESTPTEIPDVDTVINAVYDVNYHNVSWVTDGDVLTGDYTKGSTAYGTPIDAPNTPTKTGYTFKSWSPTVDATMPDNDVTYTATWDINSYTITIINSDERGGQVVLTEDYGTQLTFNNVADIEIPGVTSDPLGRYFVGFKTSPTAEEEPIKTITFDSNKTYYACYTFYDANYYQYSFDGVNYVPFTSHNDCQGGELQAYNVTIPSVTAGDQLYVKYNGNVITLSSDGNSNLNTANKVNNTAEDVTLNLFLIYDNGNYVYKPVLSGMPVDTHCASIDGVLHNTTGQQQSGFDLWEWKTEAVEIAPGQSVDAYYNGYYQFTKFDGNGDFFDFTNGKAVCKADQTLTYVIYIKETKTGTADAVYIGLTSESEALLFAQEFLEKVSGECKIEKDSEGHDIVKTDEAKLAAAWNSMSSKFSSLSSEAKAILKDARAVPESELDLEKFAASYNYIYGKYHKSLSLSDFVDRKPVELSNTRLFSVSNVSSSTWIIAAVAIVGIAAVGVFFIYRKRKEN